MQSHVVPGHVPLEEAGVGQGEAEQRAEEELGLRLGRVAQHRKGRELLVSLDFELVVVGLEAVPGVPADEGVEGGDEPALAGVVGEVEALEVVDEDEVLGVEDALDLAALVAAGRRLEQLLRPVRDHLPPLRPLLRHTVS